MHRFLLAVTVFGLSWSLASAQTDLPDALKNRPPVAAPTSQIDVAPIQVVRSLSETFIDFGGGLIEGLLSSQHVRSAGLVAVQDGRIIVTKGFGEAPVDAEFTEGLYSDVFASVAVMQLFEQQKLKLEDRVSGTADVTVEQVLTHQASSALLRQIVETASGQDFRGYVAQNILSPLAAGQTMSLSEITGRLLVALTSNGAFEGRTILAPSTVELMTQAHVSVHPALPGWAYGFAELRRNGWRGLQWDGVWQASPLAEARMVVVPEAHLAYFIIAQGHAGVPFWRTLDDALFDRVLPSRDSVATEGASPPAPDTARARALAGTYEASTEPLALAASLKSAGGRLIVRAEEDGSLILSGSEDAVLTPQPGGYWAAEGGNLNAVERDGRLVLSTGLYQPLAWWKRPVFYAALTLMFAFGAASAFVGERRKQEPMKRPSTLLMTLSGAAVALLLATLFVWHLTPVL